MLKECDVENPGCQKQLPFGNPSIKMMMTWGWFMAMGLPHYKVYPYQGKGQVVDINPSSDFYNQYIKVTNGEHNA